MILEYSDLRPHMFRLKQELLDELRKEIEDDKFLTYPKGMQDHFGVTYKRVWELWNAKGFPQRDFEGIKGVYLSELKQFGHDTKDRKFQKLLATS